MSTAPALTGDFAEITAARFRWAVHAGAGGWIDDDLAFTRDWGFDLAAITCPVVVWQGSHDLMVPPSHGEWLVAHIPRAVPRPFPEKGTSRSQWVVTRRSWRTWSPAEPYRPSFSERTRTSIRGLVARPECSRAPRPSCVFTTSTYGESEGRMPACT